MPTPADVEAMAVDNPQSWASDHIRQYLASDGAAVQHPHADRLILLYTTGRSSGLIRRTPLASADHDGDLIVAASKAGAPDNPSWYANLVANPTVWVRKKADVYEARASVIEGEQRSAAWAAMVEAVPGMARYQDKTERTIPVVRLSRV